MNEHQLDVPHGQPAQRSMSSSHGTQTTRTVTVLSPHQDDACFSLGISLMRWIRWHRILIINCFTVSDYVVTSVRGSREGVSRRRASEDDVFVCTLGPCATSIDLGFVDAPLRLGCPAEQTCLERTLTSADRTDIQALAHALLGSLEPGLVLLPLGLGSHIDHRIAKLAGLQAVIRTHQIGFYEDLPYAVWCTDEKIRLMVASLQILVQESLLPLVCSIPEGTERKRQLMLSYPSQLEADFLEHVLSRADDLGGGERLWMTHGGLALLGEPTSGASPENRQEEMLK